MADHVRGLGLAGPQAEISHNGVDATRYTVGAPPFATRSQIIIMLARGHADAPARFSLGKMISRYEELFGELLR